MERAIDAVLFDLDGTLVDSLPAIAAAMTRVLATHGYEIDDAQLVPMVGPPMELIARQLGFPPEEAARISEEYLRLYRAEYVRQTPELPGATALLERLATAGIPLGVVTNKVESSAREVLRALDWTKRFGAIIGRDTPGGAAKPEPDSALLALSILGIAPDRAAFVGDTEFDVYCARDAGIRTIVALDGNRDAAFLRAEGATHLVHSLDEVGDLLLGTLTATTEARS